MSKVKTRQKRYTMLMGKIRKEMPGIDKKAAFTFMADKGRVIVWRNTIVPDRIMEVSVKTNWRVIMARLLLLL